MIRNEFIRKYGKALVAVIAAALTVAYGALSGDQHIDPDEWIQIAIALTTAVGVYLVPLAPGYRWGKTAVAVVLSVLQVLATVILGGLDANEWIALALAGLTVVGVGMAPATSGNGITSGGVGPAAQPPTAGTASVGGGTAPPGGGVASSAGGAASADGLAAGDTLTR